jgi:uncharacterized FAD-dependent dehydrogenase
MKLLKDIKVPLDANLEDILRREIPEFSSYRVIKKSVDARKRHAIHEVYTLEVYGINETPAANEFTFDKVQFKGPKPIIIGGGPAGLFCALRLIERGIPCTLLERGSPTEKRIFKINRFWRYGEFDPEDNVCFGEGGAGFFSDGKLITRIKSDFIPYVLHRLVKFGAPEEIQYLSNPHVGSDKIRRIMPKMRKHLEENGCEIIFNTRVTELLHEEAKITGVKTADGKTYLANHIVLATGHSASDILDHLFDIGVKLEGKSFAMGLRVEHPQKFVNQAQYRKFADHPKLKSANYKLTYNTAAGIGVYSFCMCPGGYTLSSGTEADGLVCNGMSNYNRSGQFANSALVVTIDHKKIFGDDLFGGMKLRRELEKKCFAAIKNQGGTKELPVQTTQDFMKNKTGKALPTSSPSGVLPVNFNDILPKYMIDPLKEGLKDFNDKMPGFISDESQLHGIESRTSCPLRVPRDADTLVSVSHKGLYPAGEGAGYAGGITSAAVDGIRIAESIAQEFMN